MQHSYSKLSTPMAFLGVVAALGECPTNAVKVSLRVADSGDAAQTSAAAAQTQQKDGRQAKDKMAIFARLRPQWVTSEAKLRQHAVWDEAFPYGPEHMNGVIDQFFEGKNVGDVLVKPLQTLLDPPKRTRVLLLAELRKKYEADRCDPVLNKRFRNNIRGFTNNDAQKQRILKREKRARKDSDSASGPPAPTAQLSDKERIAYLTQLVTETQTQRKQEDAKKEKKFSKQLAKVATGTAAASALISGLIAETAATSTVLAAPIWGTTAAVAAATPVGWALMGTAVVVAPVIWKQHVQKKKLPCKMHRKEMSAIVKDMKSWDIDILVANTSARAGTGAPDAARRTTRWGSSRGASPAAVAGPVSGKVWDVVLKEAFVRAQAAEYSAWYKALKGAHTEVVLAADAPPTANGQTP